MGAAFVVLVDKFADQHAFEIIGEATVEAIKKVAREGMADLSLDVDEFVSVHVVWSRDAGAARLLRLGDETFHFQLCESDERIYP